MGSPGVFIHSGTLGGRLSVLAVAADASLPARPPRPAPPINALPSRKKRRRDVTTGSLPMSVGSVIVRLPFGIARMEHLYELVGNPYLGMYRNRARPFCAIGHRRRGCFFLFNGCASGIRHNRAKLDPVQVDGRRDPEIISTEHLDAALQLVFWNGERNIADRPIGAARVF